MRLALAAAFALLAVPSFAQDSICTATLAEIEGILSSHGVTYMLIDPAKLAEFAEETKDKSGEDPANVTAALIADFGDRVVFGVETKDGCFSPEPITPMAVGQQV